MMKQFYSPLLSVVPFVSILAAFLSCLPCGLAQDSALPQPQSITKVSGNWILKTANVSIQGRKVQYLTKRESMWVDHIYEQIPVVIGKDGRVEYSTSGIQSHGKAEVDGDNLVFIFSEESTGDKTKPPLRNFTTYKFKIQGDQLIISRKDQRIDEEYIFGRQ